MLSIRPIAIAADGRISPADFEAISPWWNDRGGESPTREMLGKLGVIVEQDGRPISAAFMYLDATGSGLAWLAWLAVCPRANAHKVAKAVGLMEDFLTQHARDLGYWVVMATYHNPALISLCKRRGYRKADTGMTQLFKKIA